MEYIPYGDENACSAPAFNFIEKLSSTDEYATSEKFRWTDFTKDMNDLNGNAISESQIIDNDVNFYIFIEWTVYSGKLNKDHVKVWEEQAINNKD